MSQHHQNCVFSANKCMWLFLIPTKGGGTSWRGRRPTAAPAYQAETSNSLIYVSETELRVPRHYPRCWWRRHTASVAVQSGKHWKIFVMKRVQRCPSFWGKMAPFPIWSSLSQCGRTCVRFQRNRADDKIFYEKRQMAAVTILGGPTSTYYTLSLWGIIFVFLSSFLIQ